MIETAPSPDSESAPQGFQFNPDIMADYDEQVANFAARIQYQGEPLPSFEGVPIAEVTPTFNPTSAPPEEIYARGRSPLSMRPQQAPHSEFTSEPMPVEMYRIVERSSLADGTGLVSSRILLDNTIGDVEEFDYRKHLVSNDTRRMNESDRATPFVSFSTDPRTLVKNEILRYGFGVKDGRDPVVVRVHVDPSRIVTGGDRKEREVLLLGGVAPDEYTAAYEVQDFIANVVAENEVVETVRGGMLARDEALRFWREYHSPPSYS